MTLWQWGLLVLAFVLIVVYQYRATQRIDSELQRWANKRGWTISDCQRIEPTNRHYIIMRFTTSDPEIKQGYNGKAIYHRSLLTVIDQRFEVTLSPIGA